ncbi:hypothetical protein [Paracoccus sp. T5]
MNQRAAPPEFAMSFTQEAVQLERRDGRSWRPLGQARFAGRDLASVLNALRDEAGGQAGELDTVLVIPDDQILYTTLTVPFGSDTAATVARALEGLTPYRAEDLAFDWCPAPNGDIETLRVAAVAKRTLEEAEEFARAQGFRPSGFQARPGDDRFEGQPDFGPTRLAQEQFNRRPFSEPDLSQARVTAPVIEGDIMPAAAPAVAVSRITPHVALPQAAPVVGDAAPTEADEDAATAAQTGPVIRHGQSGPLTAKRLSPRAEAVHNRAASARAQRRPEDPEPAAAPTLADRLRHLDPARLPVMVGGLFLVLLLALIFLGGQSERQAVVEAPAPQPAPVEPSIAEEPATEPVAPAPAQARSTAAVEEEAVTEPPQQPTATEPAQEQDALSRALAEAMGQGAAEPSTTPLPLKPVSSANAEPAASGQPSVTEAAAPEPAATEPEAAAVAEPIPAAALAAATATSALLPANPAPAPTPRPTIEPAATAPSAAERAPAAAPVSAAPTAAALARSPRPPRAAPAAAAAPAAPDSRPVVPSNPLPFEARAAAQPAPVTGSRPPSRPAERPSAAPAAALPAAATPTAAPAAPPVRASRVEAPAPASARPPSPSRSARPAAETPAAAPPPAPAPALSGRPPQRPQDLSSLEEGSAPEATEPRMLTEAERWLIQRQLRDLRTAQAGSTGLSPAERGLVFQLADARPMRKPVAVRAPSQQAVEQAVSEAVRDQRPESRSKQTAAAAPAAGGMARSARPASRPGALRATATASTASLSAGAVDAAIASAIESSSAHPGSVPLTALTSSSLPPRRVGSTAGAVAAATGGLAANAMVASATPVAAAIAAAPSSADLRAAAEAQAAQAAQAEQLRQDAELQAQAEARARSQAAADARAEAQARAAAEARARAQAEAEARAAASRNQRYQPPEIDQEPDVVAAVPKAAVGSAAASATVKDGIRLNSTQIIGTIGAGQASRALVRLSNGRVLTLRIGDRINGGTITAIGDSRITYQKGNQAHALGVLNGQ